MDTQGLTGESCRFPKQDELVMVQVRAIEEMGAYVTLLEYGNIEGLLPSWHVSLLFLELFY